MKPEGRYRFWLTAAVSVLLMLNTGAQDTSWVVAQDGSGQFTRIQDAINRAGTDAGKMRIIRIKPGIYREKLFIENNFITLLGEDPANTLIITNQARDIYRCQVNNDDWGVATLNLRGADIRLENLSFINEYGFTVSGDTTVPCPLDSLKKEKTLKRTAHQMALRSFSTTRLYVLNCIFRSGGGDTVSPWNTDDGMFYFRNCVMEGGVDMYCPRGWALADHCTFICRSKEAAIWHDGSKHESAKTVFFNCKFTGDEGYKLGRYHRDAQFYLVDCSFSKEMANEDIYQRMATPPNVIQWGKRVYYYNCHREGGDYGWHANNLPASIGVNDINAAWVFDYRWKPVVEKPGPADEHITGAVADNRVVFDTVAENMLLYQRANGGWPKQFNKEKVDYRRILLPSELAELRAGFESGMDATIDNNATTREIRYLAKAYKRTRDQRFLAAAEKGLEYLLKAQYTNGGWPQFWPDFSGYRGEITFNDNAMVNVLNLLVDILEGGNGLDVMNASYFNRCALAMQRGIGCILQTQIKQTGVLTAWCAQYDQRSLKPAAARAYELPSLSGQESVGIIRFLMRFDNPGPDVKKAVTSAVAWLDKVKISGYRFKEIENPATPNGKDKVLAPEPGHVCWARFYDLQTNQPFFVGRDGKRRESLAEVEHERRMGYAWYTEVPAKLLAEEYPAWAAKWLQGSSGVQQ